MIVLDIDSPGGECSGLFDLVDTIVAGRGVSLSGRSSPSCVLCHLRNRFGRGSHLRAAHRRCRADPGKTERYVELVAGPPEHGVVEIHVRDNGVGIPEAALASIFQRFTRAHADDGELTHVAGIGLGLSIVEDCVRAMGGQIVVRSTEKQGATFIMTLEPRVTLQPCNQTPRRRRRAQQLAQDARRRSWAAS